MRGFDWLVLIVVLLIAVFGREEQGARRPTPVEESGGAPSTSGDKVPDAVFKDDPSPRSDGSGSAAAIADGVWLTARHVVDQCDRVGLVSDARTALLVDRVAMLRDADVALLFGGMQGTPMTLRERFRTPGDTAIFVGYPAGVPTTVLGEYLGTLWTRTEGDWVGEEAMSAWAEIERAPRGDGPLGGLSGGPVVNLAGEISGVAVRATPRRGRVLSAQPETIYRLLREQGLSLNEVPARPVDVRGYANRGTELRDQRSVAEVYCDVF